MMYRSIALLVALVGCGEVNKISIDAPPPPPSLASVMPARGIVSTMVTLDGTAFGDAQGASTVTIDGTAATVQSWSATEIVVAVPDVKPGPRDVVITTAHGATAPQPFQVILPPRAYIHNQQNDTTGSDTVTIMTFDVMAPMHLTQTGADAQLGMPAVSFGGCDHSLVVHEPTRRLFVTSSVGLAVFDIDPITGLLTAAPGSPFIVGGSVNSVDGMEINKTGTRAFLASYTGNIAVFDIASNGTATQVTGSPFATPTVDVFALSEDEQFLYANTEGGTFAGYTVSAAGGLTALPGSPYSHGSFTFYMGRQPHSSHLLLTGSNGLHVWNPAASGVPTAATGSPFAVGKPASGTANGLAYNADGTHVYVAGQAGSSLVGVSIAADGTPTALTNSPYATTMTLTCIAMSKDDKYIVAISPGPGIGLLTVASDGQVALEAGSPYMYTAAANTSGLAITF